MANRLAHETSPYLLQHQDNPVEWYPWGVEALSRAKAENKPILLSIGYSACHWCHVMAHECFENPEIAAKMNALFVNIKVDREERPDLDHIYQNVAQAMTQGGGWPLTVFLTPDCKPFFGGTYFPPEDRYGRPGFPRVLVTLSEAYRNDSESVVENARRLTEYIVTAEKIPAGAFSVPTPPTMQGLKAAALAISSSVDRRHGGFGSAPKFPNPMLLAFLWRMGRRDEVLLSLSKMAQGGIYDQLGGGFHRYSVDESWSVPHFEKMLYDNGCLLKLYAEVVLASEENRDLHVRVLIETVGYVLSEMCSPAGGFYSAQDADSEGEEGKYFVWDPEELAKTLTANEAKCFALRFGVEPGGNFDHGKTVLHAALDLASVAARTGITEQQAASELASARVKLMQVRRGRITPLLDDKILASWNGLMISGLSWAARALDHAGHAETAVRAREAARGAFRFVRENLVRKDFRLWSTFKDGKARLNGYLDDYAFLSMAALDLARVSDDQTEIEECYRHCREWIGIVESHFADELGYFFTSDDHEALIHRPKTIFDQAIPAGTALVLECMSALSEADVAGEASRFSKRLESQLQGLFPILGSNPGGFGEMLSATFLALQGPVVASGPGAVQAIVHPHVFQKPGADRLVCHARTCSLPLKSPKELSNAVKKALVQPATPEN